MAATRNALLCGTFLVVAGCVDTGGGLSPQGADEATGVDVGGLRGLILSEEIFPVVGAVVAVGEEASTVTDDSGRYELGGLAPGMHTLNVTAEGYESASLDVEVLPGAVAEANLLLKGLPGQSPYVLSIPYEGFSVCSYSIVYSAGWPGGPCPLGERKTITKVEVGPDWRAGVYEMGWKTSEEMIFATHVRTVERPDRNPGCVTSGSTHDWCPAMVWGPSPLRILARPLDADYAKKYAIDGKETWPEGNFTSHIFTSYSGFLRGQINGTFYNQCVLINRQFGVPEHWGCPFGVGVALGIRFQFWHTTFYLEAPLKLEDYTAFRDS